MNYQIYSASERGKEDLGWLQSSFVFSFNDFYNPSKSAFGSLVVFNDDLIAAGKGFGIHPHMNMEIVTIMLEGSLSHKDDIGYNNVVHAGDVQIMSAGGSGLFHEEYSVGEAQTSLLQIWVLPKVQNIRPRYQWRSFPKDKRANQLTPVVSFEEGLGHCWINQNAKFSLGYYPAAQVIEYAFKPVNKAVFIFVMEGALTVNGEINLGRRGAAGIWNTELLKLDITAETEFIIVETVINQK